MKNGNWTAAAELLLATSIWGFGFTATIWALRAFDTVTITIGRFSIAFVIGAIILMLSPGLRHHFNRRTFRMSLWPGILLGLTLVLQTWGLEYTSATNSSFITTLYVVFVPLIEVAFLRKPKIGVFHFLWVAVALIGTGLMVNLHLGHFSEGDMLTLACSVTAGLQIVIIGRDSRQIESPFAYNTFQSFWASLIGLLFLPIYPQHYIRHADWRALVGVVSLTLGSTLFAFFLQVRAQKTLPASIASLLCLLESPFASLFAFFLIDEKITGLQLVGGFLIFLSALGATMSGFAAQGNG